MSGHDIDRSGERAQRADAMTCETPAHVYAIALGSNRRHGRFGAPANVLSAAIAALSGGPARLLALGPTITSAAIGPSQRRYANAAALVASPLYPPQMLDALKGIERAFGRRRGRRWGARVLDLDIILWSGGVWADGALSIPHPYWTERRFVLDPLIAIAPTWRDPLTGRSVRQLAARARRPQPTPLTPRPDSHRGATPSASAGP
jgi:2-amino-4-hydroxy-6-hydroxymethyldihydropteridine diphosphokinase